MGAERILIDLTNAVARITDHGDGEKTLQIFTAKGEALTITLSESEQAELIAALAPKQEGA